MGRESEISRVGVVGAGTMGNGIAHVFALTGLSVQMVDVDTGALESARRTIERNLARQLEKGRIEAAEARAALGRVQLSTELETLSEADLVVEAVPERLELKREIFRRLSGICRPDAVLATNTSSLSITRLGASVRNPGRFLGLHFMNPVPVMQLVEVVRGLETSDATTARALEVCRRIGKTPVEVRDAPGFVSNRVLMPMINEAIFALMEGVAEAPAIDEVMKLGMNHPMGPLALADFIGLDVCLAVMEVLHGDMGEDKYRPCPLLRQYVDAGWLGRKTGRGFYAYDGER